MRVYFNLEEARIFLHLPSLRSRRCVASEREQEELEDEELTFPPSCFLIFFWSLFLKQPTSSAALCEPSCFLFSSNFKNFFLILDSSSHGRSFSVAPLWLAWLQVFRSLPPTSKPMLPIARLLLHLLHLIHYSLGILHQVLERLVESTMGSKPCHYLCILNFCFATL